ncbi:hypothetical protein F5Y14DRAFT_81096 [Nemania sp. NC0429]|nr:hypothetical protein F5Y14DRAFT_81096 [Nemania sp. NC0429]
MIMMLFLSSPCSRTLLAVSTLFVLGASTGCSYTYSSYGVKPTTFPLPAPPRRTNPSSLLPNGDFECGIAPWTVIVPDQAITYSVGAPAHTGSNSLQVNFTPPSGRTQSGISVRLVSAPVRVVPNVAYQLTFWTWFDNAEAGYIDVTFNEVSVYVVNATDHGYGGDFRFNTIDYIPTTDTVIIKFEYSFSENLLNPNIDRIDSITLEPVQ